MPGPSDSRLCQLQGLRLNLSAPRDDGSVISSPFRIVQVRNIGRKFAVVHHAAADDQKYLSATTMPFGMSWIWPF